MMSLDRSTAFRYGFMSSKASGALGQYLNSGQVSPDQQGAVNQARAMIVNVVQAHSMFVDPGAKFAPTVEMLDACGCALGVVNAHPDDFGVNTPDDFARLFIQFQETLNTLANGTAQRVDVERCRKFFRQLAGQMHGWLSVSTNCA
ncbi:MAG: hypothetical protein WC773_01615 [Patescibacteria group bacterium]|jgi:hypothetical protein